MYKLFPDESQTNNAAGISLSIVSHRTHVVAMLHGPSPDIWSRMNRAKDLQDRTG